MFQRSETKLFLRKFQMEENTEFILYASLTTFLEFVSSLQDAPKDRL